MARPKATAKKRRWRPDPYNPDFTCLTVRVLITDAERIQAAAEAQATRTSVPVSRNNFCARAIVSAATKELARIVSFP